MILYVNACTRKCSRTKRLANYLLSKADDEICEINIMEKDFPNIDEEFLNKRNICSNLGKFDEPIYDYPKMFARADSIVIAAPYWDLSFPAKLKQYFEIINTLGITFAYTNDGIPYSLCKANKLYYVTTAGGEILDDSFGFGYVKALCNNFYNINDVRLIKAEKLDIYGQDEEKILKNAENTIVEY